MDWESDDESDTSPRRAATRTNPRRAAKVKTPSRVTRATAPYFGSPISPSDEENGYSSNDEDDISEDVTDPATGSRKRKQLPVQTLASKRPRRNPTRISTKKSPTTPRSSRKPIPKAPKHKALPIHQAITPLVGDWASLPYMIWIGVFDHVAAPLRDTSARQEDQRTAVESLLKAAKASKVLTEPALTALYKCPPLTPGATLYLSRTLSLPPDATMLKYQAKVQTLRIEVGETLAKKVAGSHINLKDLIQNLPRLEEVELHHMLDVAPYRQLDVNIRWKYPEELFEALSYARGDELGQPESKAPITLRSWTWNSRLAGESCALDKLEAIHKTASFTTLRQLRFVNYQVPSLHTKTADEAEIAAMDLPQIERLAAAISALPRLEHLIFESSTMVNAHLLELLPRTLKHIELINCWDVTAETLRDFLLTHGVSLERLTLDHCQALSLAFLPVLETACPRLTHLSMDLRYFRHVESYNDSDPDYAALLEVDQVPKWPQSLEYINIQHMRNWGGISPMNTAVMFFKSLTDQAGSLPNLRQISLKAEINAPFKERCRFRDEWISRMDEVFRRPLSPPVSIQHFLHARRVKVQEQQTASRRYESERTVPARRSTRIAERPESPVAPVEQPELAATKRAFSAGGKIRPESSRQNSHAIRKRYDTDDESCDDELSLHSWQASLDYADTIKQQLCDVVDIQVDNRKVGETEYKMIDFLDSPENSDDDQEWDGTDQFD